MSLFLPYGLPSFCQYEDFASTLPEEVTDKLGLTTAVDTTKVPCMLPAGTRHALEQYEPV
jgi:hypothetical protein